MLPKKPGPSFPISPSPDDTSVLRLSVEPARNASAKRPLTSGGTDNPGSGSDETSVPTQQADQDVRMALDAARASLQEMRRVYDEMEARHREETSRRKEESLSLEKLLTSLLSSKGIPPSSSS
ncbi:hypothetical protein BN14_08197 [Rhizoctonia solani AG-1 IB]|uniref:Uncharacterized protein n=1 Tax=Thanatephorus cucumeris (strain AG1-IB / isolate 7/3/14) TaxID=1108050 RepID=M5C501_THACB|nr:hypothetical protein BN14_08197 [Rhizoctonia solani AG-1 IB]